MNEERTEMSKEMSDEVSLLTHQLFDIVRDLPDDKRNEWAEKGRSATPTAYQMLFGNRGLAILLKDQAADASLKTTFSDQLDYEIREMVISAVNWLNLGVGDIQEIREHLLDFK